MAGSLLASTRLAQVYEAALQSSSCRLRAIIYTQLAEDAVDVTLDRCFGYVQPVGNCFVAMARHDLLEHFDLASREIGTAHSLCQPLRHLGRNPARPSVHLPDRIFQFLEEHVLQQVTLSSGLQRTVNIFIAVKGGKMAMIASTPPNSGIRKSIKVTSGR